MANQNPEQIARDNIDKQLTACGWIIQGIKQVNLNAGLGVAVKEYLTDVGPVDYLLFVEGKPCGAIEAKREEETITQSLQQTETLRQSILKKAFEGKLVTMPAKEVDNLSKAEGFHKETAPAPKGRNTRTMGAAHRNESVPPAKAPKGWNKL